MISEKEDILSYLFVIIMPLIKENFRGVLYSIVRDKDGGQ
jgi:hypothetical protein